MSNVLDFGEYGSDTRPARVGAGSRKPWAKDPTSPSGQDGTRIDATFANDFVALIRATLVAFGIAANAGEDSALADAIRAAISSTVGVANGIAPLDGTGLVPVERLPAIAITDTLSASSDEDMIALDAQQGDVCIRDDLNKSYILAAAPASTLANWKLLKAPTDGVLSVAGLVGVITAAALKVALAITKSDVSGLSDDLAAINSALSSKAPLTSPSLLGATALSTDDNANVTPLHVEGDRATPTNNDIVSMDFRLSNDAGTQGAVASISARNVSVAAGTENGRLIFGLVNAGGLASRLQLSPTYLAPWTDGALTLGTSSARWDSAFLKVNGKIDFGAGNVTITHGSGQLAIAGVASGGVSSDGPIKVLGGYGIGNGSGNLAIGSTSTGSDNVSVCWGDGTGHNLNLGYLSSGTFTARYTFADSGVFSPAINDGATLGSASKSWADGFFAAGATLNFNNGNVVITHSSGALNLTGLLNMNGYAVLDANDVGSSVQAYDANTLKANVWKDLTAGYTSSNYDAGTKSSGTFTPLYSSRNAQKCVNGGAFALAPPSGDGSMVLDITNNASAGTIDVSAFTKKTGDAFDLINGHGWRCYITTGQLGSHIHVQKMF